jgi:hypothetical protein
LVVWLFFQNNLKIIRFSVFLIFEEKNTPFRRRFLLASSLTAETAACAATRAAYAVCAALSWGRYLAIWKQGSSRKG